MTIPERMQVTRQAIEEELKERAARIRARNPQADKASDEEAALYLAIKLIEETKERGQAILYTTEQYVRRVLHFVRWSGSNIGAEVMIEYLIHHGGDALDMYFLRLLDQTEYRDGDDLPEEMRRQIQRMREEGRDPLEGYKPGYNKPGNSRDYPLEPMRLQDGLTPAAWSELVAQVKQMEARHPQLSNREILIEELTDRWINALKTNNLFLSHSRSHYRSCIATLMFQYAHPLLAGLIFSLLVDNGDDQRKPLTTDQR